MCFVIWASLHFAHGCLVRNLLIWRTVPWFGSLVGCFLFQFVVTSACVSFLLSTSCLCLFPTYFLCIPVFHLLVIPVYSSLWSALTTFLMPVLCLLFGLPEFSEAHPGLFCVQFLCFSLVFWIFFFAPLVMLVGLPALFVAWILTFWMTALDIKARFFFSSPACRCVSTWVLIFLWDLTDNWWLISTGEMCEMRHFQL